MNPKAVMKWGKKAASILAVVALAACVEIKSDAKIASDAKVSFSTTYDMTKILPTLQQMSKDGGDVAKNLSCDKMNEKLTKSLTCKDITPGKFVVSGDFMGEAGNGVTLDKDKNQLIIDAVQLFRTVADLNPSKEPAAGADPTSMLLQKGLVPVALDQAAIYKQMGMALSLNVTLPADVLTIDGAAAKDIKDNTVSINFIDIAGKDSYVITSKASKSRIIWKILFILLAIALIAAAVMYLMKRQKSNRPNPSNPSGSNSGAVVAPMAAESATDVDSSIDTPHVVETVNEKVTDVAENVGDELHEVKTDVVDEVSGAVKKAEDVIEGVVGEDQAPKA